MTIRDAIQDLLAGLGHDADPGEVLGQHGFDALPAEALSSALLHFAERAPMAIADVLAPVVTRISGVPFAEGDLPPSGEIDAILADGGNVFDLLTEIDVAELTYDNTDPSELDLVDHLDDVTTADGSDPSPESADYGEDSFGTGDDSVEHDLDDVGSEFDDVFDQLEDVASQQPTEVHERPNDTSEPAADELQELATTADLDDNPLDDGDDPLEFDLD